MGCELRHTGMLPKTTSDYARAIRKRAWVVLAVALVVIPAGDDL